MKILYCILAGKSGSDVYYNLLMNSQRKLKTEAHFKSYHRFWSLCPYALKPLINTKIDIVKCNYDIVHSNAEYGFIFKSNYCPLIVTVHHIILTPFKIKYLSQAQQLYYQLMLKYIRYSIQNATRVITVSKATEFAVRNYFHISNVQTIYNGIDVKLFRPTKIEFDPYLGKVKLLFVGNLTKRKGVDLLPKILEKLDNRFLIFYTSGLRTPRTIFADKRLIPLERLTIQELVYWYNLCDICLLPTRLEGFGYAVAEAMACAKPVVTTNCSSLPEIVIDGETGFLCKMEDVNDFVDKIKMLADNETMRIEMGLKGRKRIEEHFNLEKMGKEYYEMYKNVIKEFYGSERAET